MRNAHNALHSVAWFVAGADGTVLGEIASGNIQTVCAFPTDLSASKSFDGTGLEAADSRSDGRLEIYWLPSPSTRHRPCTRGSADPSQAEIFTRSADHTSFCIPIAICCRSLSLASVAWGAAARSPATRPT